MMPTPLRVLACASELPATERWCTCCKKPLVRKFAWLELDQRINTYHDFGGVPDDRSQGWFPFGLTCAKKLKADACIRWSDFVRSRALKLPQAKSDVGGCQDGA